MQVPPGSTVTGSLTIVPFVPPGGKGKRESRKKAVSVMTELVFVLDRSGSMGGLESDTIGGFNAMLEKQQKELGECRITTVLFDNEYEILHDRLDINAVRKIDEEDYYVRGTTALLDAVGKTINKLSNVQKNSLAGHRPNKVLFVITTDGMENASKEFSYNEIKSLIKSKKEKYNWEFIFLGANIDAEEVADSFGIDKSRAQNFHNDSKGIELNYKVLSSAIACFRQEPAGEALKESWCEEIQADFEARS